MATVTITIKDEGDIIDYKIIFDPEPGERPRIDQLTPAQLMAIYVRNYMYKYTEKHGLKTKGE